MTEPVNSMSQRAWQDSTDPVEKFGVWSIRAGRYWKFNIVSRSWVTASDAEKAALDKERAVGNPPAPEPKPDSPGNWDELKWGD